MRFDTQIDEISSWLRSNQNRASDIRSLWLDENGRAFTDVVAESYFIAAKSMQEKAAEGRELQQRRTSLEATLKRRQEESQHVAEQIENDWARLSDHLSALANESMRLESSMTSLQKQRMDIVQQFEDSARSMKQLAASAPYK